MLRMLGIEYAGRVRHALPPSAIDSSSVPAPGEPWRVFWDRSSRDELNNTFIMSANELLLLADLERDDADVRTTHATDAEPTKPKGHNDRLPVIGVAHYIC